MKYREKPKPLKIVDAQQFTPDKKPWPKGVYDRVGGSRIYSSDRYWLKCQNQHCIEHTIKPNDWIITESNGSRYSMSNTEFNRNFELIN